MKSKTQPERYRVIFNDIDNYIQSMLATRKLPLIVCHYQWTNKSSELNYFVTDGVLKRGNIVRLTQFQASIVKDKW